MLALPLNRTTRHRLLVCLLLLTGLLAAGAGVLPVSAQQRSTVEKDTAHRYGWINGGVGSGRTGFGLSVVGGSPIGHRLFLGGRYVRTKELALFKSPAPTTWDAGPLVGLVEQGRWGHLSLATGLAAVGGRRLDDPKSTGTGPCFLCTREYESDPFQTIGIPFDVQAFFTPIRYVGIGIHGYANVNPGDNMLGWSLELQVRLHQ